MRINNQLIIKIKINNYFLRKRSAKPTHGKVITPQQEQITIKQQVKQQNNKTELITIIAINQLKKYVCSKNLN
jgi:hypothetical protein